MSLNIGFIYEVLFLLVYVILGQEGFCIFVFAEDGHKVVAELEGCYVWVLDLDYF